MTDVCRSFPQIFQPDAVTVGWEDSRPSVILDLKKKSKMKKEGYITDINTSN
jgi:hypothetical protein